MKKKEFDPLEYIENAFMDKNAKTSGRAGTKTLDVAVPSIGQYLGSSGNGRGDGKMPKRFRKTQLSAPRPRRAAEMKKETPIDSSLQAAIEALPRSIDFLFSYYDDQVTSNYYRGNFKESREQLVRRLLDPELTLEEVSRLLGVCPATVRRYTNRKWLSHHRTKGGQRRFRLGDVVRFVELHGRFPEE